MSAAALRSNVVRIGARRRGPRPDAWHEGIGGAEDGATGERPTEDDGIGIAADAGRDGDDDEGLAADFADRDGPEAHAVSDRTAGHESAAEPADDALLATWIARVGRQDERALEALYDATASRVYGLVLRIVRRPEAAEEVLEDTFWQIWRQAPRFDAQRGRPITWVLAMARSRALDALRRERRFSHEPLPEDDVAGAGEAASSPQDLLDATRSHAAVHAALASLEPRARQLISLAFLRGLTHEEIAEQAGLPLGSVKSLIRRGLAQLRRVMEAGHG